VGDGVEAMLLPCRGWAGPQAAVFLRFQGALEDDDPFVLCGPAALGEALLGEEKEEEEEEEAAKEGTGSEPAPAPLARPLPPGEPVRRDLEPAVRWTPAPLLGPAGPRSCPRGAALFAALEAASLAAERGGAEAARVELERQLASPEELPVLAEAIAIATAACADALWARYSAGAGGAIGVAEGGGRKRARLEGDGPEPTGGASR